MIPETNSSISTTEQARRNIEEYVGNPELGSSRFQAFADYVDWQEAQFLADKNKSHELRSALIEENIRQRKNGVSGYQREFETVSGLHKKLLQAIDSQTRKIQLAKSDEYSPPSDIIPDFPDGSAIG